MDALTFAEWIAYNSIEPIDPAGALLAGMSTSKTATPPAAPSDGGLSFMKTMFPPKAKADANHQ